MSNQNPLASSLLAQSVNSSAELLAKRAAESAARLSELRESQAQMRAAEDAQRERNANSLANKLNLDPTNDPGLYTLANFGANALETVRTMVANSVATPDSINNLNKLSDVDNATRDAYLRYTQGVPTPDDLKKLNSKVVTESVVSDPMAEMNGIVGGGSETKVRKEQSYTYLEAIQDAEKSRNRAGKIRAFGDMSSLYDTRSADAFNEQAKQVISERPDVAEAIKTLTTYEVTGADQLKALGVLAKNAPGLIAERAKLVKDNPGYMIEQSPSSIISGALTLAGPAGNALNALQTAGQGLANVDEGFKNKAEASRTNPYQDVSGFLPTTQEEGRMKTGAALYTGAELFGDRVMAGAGKGAYDAAKKAASLTAAKEAIKATGKDLAEGVTDSAFKQALKGAATATGRLAAAAETEAITETASTVFEGMSTLKNPTAQDLLTANTVGWALGAGMPVAGTGAAVGVGAYQTGKAVAGALSEAASNVKEQGQAAANAAMDRAKAAASNINTENVINSVDQAGSFISEARAKFDEVKAAVASQFESGVGSLSPEMKSTLQSAAQTFNNAVDKAADFATQSVLQMADVAQTAASTVAQKFNDSGLADKAESTVESAMARYRDLRDQFKAEFDAELAVQQKAQAGSAVQSALDAAVGGSTESTQDAAVPATKTAELQQAQVEAIKEVKLRSMAAPESLSVADANEILNDSSSNLSNEDREYFTKFRDQAQAFNDAAEASKGTGKDGFAVKNEVLFGNKSLNQKGLKQFQERFSAFMGAGVVEGARNEVAGLIRFATAHASKFNAFSQALTQAQAGQGNFKVAKSAEGQWQATPFQGSFADRKPGEFIISKGSSTLVAGVQAELNAMGKTLEFMSQMKDAQGNALISAEQISSILGSSNAATSTSTSVGSTTDANQNQQGQGSIEVGGPGQPPGTDASVQGNESASPVDGKPNGNDSSNNDNAEDGSAGSGEGGVKTEVVKDTGPVLDALTADLGGMKDEETKAVYEDFRTQITQSNGKASDDSKLPLATKKNFVSRLVAGELKAEDFMLNGMPDGMLPTYNWILKAVQTGNEALAGLIRRESTQPKYFYKAPVDYLMGGDEKSPTLEENIRSAISVGGLEGFLRMAGNLSNTDEAINELFGDGRSKDSWIDSNDRQKLNDGRVRESTLFHEMGRSVVQVLGLKATSQAHANLLPKLETALGGYAVDMLMARGVIEKVVIPKAEWASMIQAHQQRVDVQRMKQGLNPKTWPKTEFQDQIFYRAARSAENKFKLDAKAEAAKKNLGMGAGMFSSLFGVESDPMFPTFEAKNFTQSKAQKSAADAPQFLKDVLQKKNQEPNYLREYMNNLVQSMAVSEQGREALLGIMGAVHLEGVHANRKDTVEAKNMGLERDLNNALDFITTWEAAREAQGADRLPVFLQHVIWKNQRVGIMNHGFNPQTSKLVRHLISRDSWTTEVDPQNPESLNNFKLRVLEGFGVKTDRQSNTTSLKTWGNKTSSPSVQSAVNAIAKNMFSGEAFTQTELKSLRNAVQEGGEGMRTLDSLLALAELKNSEGKPFKTNLIGEVDGVNNGPMLSRLLMGAAASVEGLFETLKKGGFFKDAVFNAYNIFREQTGDMDFYQDVMNALNKRLAVEVNPKNLQVIQTLYGKYVDDSGKVSSDGRNAIKEPINALNFGSSVNSAINGMARDFAQVTFKRLEKLVASGEDIQPFIKTLNSILPEKEQIPLRLTPQQVLEYKLSARAEQSIQNYFTETVGASVEATLTDKFGVMLDRRDQMVQSTNIMFKVYQAAYDAARKSLREKRVADGVFTAGDDLTVGELKQLDEFLKPLMPFVATMNSMARNNPDAADEGLAADGVLMAKSEKVVGDDAKLYASRYGLNPQNSADGQKVRGGIAWATSLADPGVLVGSATTHSFDSYVSHLAVTLTEALNIHDAHVSGLKDYLQVAQNFNKALFQGLLDYSPANAVYKGLERQTRELIGLLNKLEGDPIVRGEIIKSVEQARNDDRRFQKWVKDAKLGDAQTTWQSYLAWQLEQAKANAYTADKIRLGALSVMQVLDQYALEGGAYMVTEADRKIAQERLALLEQDKTVPAELLQSLNALPLTDSKAEAMQTFVRQVFGLHKEFSEGVIAFAESRADTPEHIKALIAAYKDRAQVGFGWTQAYELGQYIKTAAEIRKAEKAKASGVSGKGEVPAAKTTVFGEVGVALSAHDADVFDLFKDKSTISAQEAMKGLNAKLPSGFFKTILGKMFQAVDPKTTVRMIRADDADLNSIPRPAVTSFAWFDPSTKTVYVLSPEFKTSLVNKQMMMHELLHAATDSVLNSPRTTSQKAAVKQLQNILAEARKFIKGNEALEEKWGRALVDEHELLAWGMTSKGFQNEVLAKVSIAEEGKNTFSSALQKFVDSLMKMLFGDKTTSAETGALKDLFVSGVELLNQAKAQNDREVNASVAKANRIHSMQANGGSQPNQPSGAQANANTLYEFDSEQVFDALGFGTNDTTITHDDALLDVLRSIVNLTNGKFGAIKAEMQSAMGVSALDAWAHSLTAGARPFASALTRAPIQFTPREKYVAEQVEATVRALLNNPDLKSQLAIRNLEKLYLAARTDLKGNISPQAYDWIFKVEADLPGGKSSYLAKFAAMALAHEKFGQTLEKHTTAQTKKALAGSIGITWKPGMKISQLVAQVWDSILGLYNQLTDRIQGRVTKFQGGSTMRELITSLAQIDAKNKERAAAGKGRVEEAVDTAYDWYQTAEAYVKDKAFEAATTAGNYFEGSKWEGERVLGRTINAMANSKVKSVTEAINKIYNEKNARQGEWMKTVNFILGPGKWANEVIREAKRIEAERKAVKNTVASAVMAGFKDGGANLSQEDKAAISALLLRTGAHVLLDNVEGLSNLSVQSLQTFLEQPAELQKEIDAAINKLKTDFPNEYRFYVAQSKGLAALKITGHAQMEHQLTNPVNIARGLLTSINGNVTDAQVKAAAPVIARLTALHGLKYADKAENSMSLTGGNYKDTLLDLLKKENSRTDGNGVLTTLKMHSHLVKESRQKIFSGSESLEMFGYVPEMLNSRVDLQMGIDDKGTQLGGGETLSDRGYTRVGKVVGDPSDPSGGGGTIWAADGAGMSRYVSGGASMTGMGAKGTSKFNGYFSQYSQQGIQNMQDMDALNTKIKAAAARQLTTPTAWEPSFDRTFLLPSLDGQGNLTDYRYVMTERLKDTALQRDNSFDQMLGAMAASTYDKEQGREHNRKVFTDLKKMFDEAKKQEDFDRADFMYIGVDAKDEKSREAWNMLPSNTKLDIQNIWDLRDPNGDSVKGFWIRKELALPVLGTRKLSLASLWDQEFNQKDFKSVMANAFKEVVEWMLEKYARYAKDMDEVDARRYRARAQLFVSRAEEGARELVQEIKDIIVVKTGVVLWANFLSNLSLLIVSGVNPVQAVKDQIEAWKYIREYEVNKHALDALKLELDTGLGQLNRGELLSEIARLEDAIARNPVQELVEAGMLPSVVEDVENDADPFSYRTRFFEAVESKTSKVPAPVKTAARVMYMAHDTALYKFMSSGTRYSDFMARYALYKHLTEHKQNPVAKDEALFQASETFVNYDVPMPQSLQYLDDMNIVPFMKYTLSIQRVLARLGRDRPLNILQALMLNSALSGLPLVTDSFISNKVDWFTIHGGVSDLPAALGDLATVEVFQGIVK